MLGERVPDIFWLGVPLQQRQFFIFFKTPFTTKKAHTKKKNYGKDLQANNQILRRTRDHSPATRVNRSPIPVIKNSMRIH